ncbi:MAG: lysylphosphatidylglycerol synthase transmembrane domain-containing protein, partial [Gemmatimonadota bacterium]|nr:lysylphosphatidylglycerol synthase transmembrane domain-containing protein [Gemmatimonadota bacterium]
WAIRWRILLGAVGMTRGLLEVFRLILVALFFNMFLPGSVGGDVVRGIGVSDAGRSRAAVIASVVGDRMVGTFALGLVALAGSLAGMLLLPGAAPWALSTTVAGCVLFGLAVVTRPALLRRLLRRLRGEGLRARLHRVVEASSFLAEHRPAVTRALVSSLGLAGFAVVFHWAVARSLGVDLPLSIFFVLVPAVELAAAVPITPNGLGIREMGYVVLLERAGVDPTVGAVFAGVSFALKALLALVGGGLFAWKGLSTETAAVPR